MTAPNPHVFVWYELMSKAPEGSAAFYTALNDWGTVAWDGGMPYTMFTHKEAPFAGIMQLPQEAQDAGAPSHWLGYVNVDDVDACIARAVELGASVLVPGTDIETVGRFGVFKDPQGAVLAVYKSADPKAEPSSDRPSVGQFSWHELMADDFRQAFEFYGALFSWQIIQEMDMGEAGTYAIYGLGERALGGMFNRPQELPQASWLYYLEVADVPATIERATELGATLLQGPIEVPGGTIAQMLDPQGAAFALHAQQATNA